MLISIIIFLLSCSPISEDLSDSDKKVLTEIFNQALKKNLNYSNAHEYDPLSDKLRFNRIDELKIYFQETYDQLEIDSIAVFTKNSRVIWTPTSRIIYDFAQNPRNVRSETVDIASYKRIQLDERWYVETQGFD